MRRPDSDLDVSRETSPAPDDESQIEAEPTFSVPAPGRERLYGMFDGVPPQASTRRNIANRRRMIE